MPDIVVIGAGISGLTAAYQLQKAGKDVLVLEASSKIGGKIQSERIDGYLLEAGPNSLRIDNRETLDLINELGLSSRMIQASPYAKKRFLLKNGNWIKVPAAPQEAIATPLFSLAGKMRVLCEPFISKTKLEDESVASFITRRLGNEVFQFAVDPFVAGIYAGNPDALSMQFAFPNLWNAEQQHGSLMIGLLNNRKKRTAVRIKSKIISFPNGLTELTSSLHNKLTDRLRFHESVTRIDCTPNGYSIASSNVIEAKQIIFALPAHETASLLSSIVPALSTSLRTIDYPPVAVAYLGYRNDQFKNIPEGFGGLIPSIEQRNILGIIFSSSNFPGRAPDGHVLLTVMMGGASHLEINSQSQEEMLGIAIKEVADLLKSNGLPVFQHLQLWESAIPQYNIGYGNVLRSIDTIEKKYPGLFFIGNYRGGVALGACIKNATELVKTLVS